MASNWQQTFEELKKKKKEIDKAENKKEVSNINHKYNKTTNNRTMLDGYGNNNSLQIPNYVKATPISTAKKDDKKWYQKFFKIETEKVTYKIEEYEDKRIIKVKACKNKQL